MKRMFVSERQHRNHNSSFRILEAHPAIFRHANKGMKPKGDVLDHLTALIDSDVQLSVWSNAEFLEIRNN